MANGDKHYADMVKLMREQGAKNNPTTLLLGVMQSSNSVKVGDLLLSNDDLYISSDLMAGYQQDIVTPYVKSVDVIVSGGSATVNALTEDTLTFKGGLKKGDIVAVMKLDSTDKDHLDTYVILAKVVRA